MTDKNPSMLDAAQQAVRMERIEGEHRMLASQVKQSVDALTSTLHALQADTRNVSNKLSDMATLQQSHDNSREAIGEMRKSLTDLNSRLEDWFSDFEQRSTQRWDRFERERNEWRTRHEAENENDKKDFSVEIRTVRETVIRTIGFGSALGVLAGVITGGFLWNINYRFNEGKENIVETREVGNYNRTLIDALNRDYGKEIADIKLYLARGGRIPEEPYIPQSQRKDDGQATGKP